MALIYYFKSLLTKEESLLTKEENVKERGLAGEEYK